MAAGLFSCILASPSSVNWSADAETIGRSHHRLLGWLLVVSRRMQSRIAEALTGTTEWLLTATGEVRVYVIVTKSDILHG